VVGPGGEGRLQFFKAVGRRPPKTIFQKVHTTYTTAPQSNNSFQKVHTTFTTAPHNHSQHNLTSSHEVLTSLVLVLLMMGIMMLETY
jgi:hypothetical protein